MQVRDNKCCEMICVQVSTVAKLPDARFSLQQDGKIRIRIMSKSKTPFKGFLLKAVNVTSNEIMGSFTILESGPKTSAQYLNCTNPQSAITHTNNQQKLLQTEE